MASSLAKSNEDDDVEGKPGSGCLYVKVSLDGAPYLRKIDLKTYNNYMQLSSALEEMFSCFTIGTLFPSSYPRKFCVSMYRHLEIKVGDLTVS